MTLTPAGPAAVTSLAALCGTCGTAIVKTAAGWTGCDPAARGVDFPALVGEHTPDPAPCTITAEPWDATAARQYLADHLAALEREIGSMDINAQTGSAIGREVARLRVAVHAEPLTVHVSSLWAGDVITLDGERLTLAAVGWSSEKQSHVLEVEGESRPRLIPSKTDDGAPTAVLHSRRGVGGLRAVYEVGDRVMVLAGGINPRWTLGVVVEDFSHPEIGLGFEIALPAGGRTAASPESMRRDTNPTPKVGEIWATVKTGQRFTVTAVEQHGMLLTADRPGWFGLITSADYMRPAAAGWGSVIAPDHQ